MYAVDDRKLAALDELEAHPKFYRRRLEDVRLQTNVDQIIRAWIYLLPTWKPELIGTPHLEDYSTLGDHCRPYVARYLRATDLAATNYDLVADLRGGALS